jgi:hypothetical protein
VDQSERELRPLRVDLEELAMALEDASFETSWCLDTVTGEVMLTTPGLDPEIDRDIAAIESDQTRRYVTIPHAGSQAGYEDMQDFIETVRDAHFRELLEVAIIGRGAFRRFKDVVERNPGEQQRWFEFHNRRMEDRAREWLADEGWEPVPKDAPQG